MSRPLLILLWSVTKIGIKFFYHYMDQALGFVLHQTSGLWRPLLHLGCFCKTGTLSPFMFRWKSNVKNVNTCLLLIKSHQYQNCPYNFAWKKCLLKSIHPLKQQGPLADAIPTSLERFGEKDLFFRRWKLWTHCFKSRWTLVKLSTYAHLVLL